MKKQDAERDMNVRWMKNPDLWSRWPLLPMKRRDERGQFPTVGFMVAGKGPIVYRGAIFALNPGDSWNSFSREEYESYEAIFNAGWRVD